jgi:hypothetical protein
MAIKRKIINRQKEVKLRKNFLATFIITFLLWLGVAGIVYFINPYENGATILFFLVLFFALFFTFSIIFVNSRRGFVTSTGITLFITLRYFGLGNILNFFLIAGICTAIELYFSKR